MTIERSDVSGYLCHLVVGTGRTAVWWPECDLLARPAWPVAQRVTVRRENVVSLDSHMATSFRVERILLCPFCGEPVAGPADRASLTLKRANDCLVHWTIHERCFVERIAAAAAERL